jgi:transcriptional regulator with XRE-family HTH domain
MGLAALQSSFDSEAVAIRLREEIARRRISRQGLAQTARVSLSTLEKALSGSRPFTLATVIRLEDALGTPLRAQSPAAFANAPVLAPPHMGSYAREAVRWIEGKYLTLRPSFGDPQAIYAYRTDIVWDQGVGHLVFAESDRIDAVFAQAGFVSMPNLSGHIYLMTSESGQYRMIVLGRATRERRMFGLLSTLQVGAGSQLVPVGCPIAFVPVEHVEDARFGQITEADGLFERDRSELDSAVEKDFCREKR